MRQAIDAYIRNMLFAYATDPAGGGYENYTDSQSHPLFPLVEDTPVGTAPCTLFR